MQPLETNLAGQVPFRSALHKHEADVTVTGVMPAWLRGQVVRTAPAVFQTPDWHATHWFDGLGMLYAFTVEDSGRVTFRQRQLESQIAKSPQRGRGFATGTQTRFFARMFGRTPNADNTNVNVVPFGDELVALTETAHQWVIDPKTLEAQKYVSWSDAQKLTNMLAHPQFDFERGRVVNAGTAFGKDSYLSVFEHAPNSRERKEIGRVPTARVPYTHSFGLSAKHAVLVAHPFDVSPLSLLFSKNKGYIDHFQWRPEEGTRVVVIDRATGALREHRAKPFFVFHTVNTFEEGDVTVLDLIAYDSPEIVQRLSAASMALGFPDLRSKMIRLRLRKGIEAAEVVELSDTTFELPSIHSKRFAGQPHQHVWGASLWSDSNGIGSRVVKVDAKSGVSKHFEDPDYVFGEPLFVARPDAEGEDDGVLLVVGSHRTADRACLQVLDANALGPIARAEVPVPLPLGFHGSFLRTSIGSVSSSTVV